MSSDVLSSLENLPPVLTNKLRGLRRLIGLWFTLDGLNRLLSAAICLIGIDLVLDWTFRMDRAQRGIMLVLIACALIWVILRSLIRPLKTHLTDEALALEMERQGAFSEKLISALEFSRTDWSQHPNVAAGLVRHTIAEGMDSESKISASSVLRNGKLWANLVYLIFLLVAAGGLVLACIKTPTMSTWFNRNVMLGNAAWPQDFYFRVQHSDGSVLRVPRGDDYTLTAFIRDGYRYLPEEVKIEFRSGAGRRREVMNRSDDGRFFRNQMISVTEPFSFRITSKKIKSEWYEIELLRRPEISEVELLAKPPAYTGTEVMVLPPGQGPYYVLKGSSLGVRGQSDKPLASAAIVSGEKRWPLEVKGNAFGGAVPSEHLASGSYQLEIEDTERIPQEGAVEFVGLGTRDPVRFKLRLKDDETPKIKARLEGVSGMVVSRARLPYQATLSDDFAIDEVKLAWQWREDTSEAAETTGDHTPSSAASKLGQPTMDLREAFEIEALSIPVGSRLSLHLQATDNDVVSGPKIGESTKMIVRVVSEAELRDDLLRREKEQRQLLTEMVDRQDLLLTDCQALAAQTREAANLERELRSEVVRVVKRQDLLAKGLLPMVERLQGMVAEITNNKLEDEEGILRERLRQRIISPLADVARSELTLASEYLGLARRAGDQAERNLLFQAAINNQQAGLRRLREILVHMVKNESYQQAVNLLYEIQKSQEDLRKRTEEEKSDLLDKVLQNPESEQDPASSEDTPPESP